MYQFVVHITFFYTDMSFVQYVCCVCPVWSSVVYVMYLDVLHTSYILIVVVHIALHVQCVLIYMDTACAMCTTYSTACAMCANIHGHCMCNVC